MKYVDIIFGPYLPDLGGAPGSTVAGYLVDAIGIRYTPNGWRCAPTFAEVASATTAIALAPVSAYCAYNGTNTCFFALDGSSVFESRNQGTDTWQNVTPAAGGAVGPYGDFIRFDDDVIIVPKQNTRTPISKSLSAAHATLFAALPGSPPTAECGARVRQHVVLGNLTGTDIYAVQTSAIGDHEDWPTPGTADARAKESIQESLNPQFGPVRRILGGEKFGIVMQDTALTRMTYVGGGAVFEFDTYDSYIGSGTGIYNATYGGAKPVSDGKFWYWYNEYGFFATDGYSVKDLSEGKISESIFYDSMAHPDGGSAVTAYSSVYDPDTREILFDRSKLKYSTRDGHFSFMGTTTALSFFNGFSAANIVRTTHAVSTGKKLMKYDGAPDTIELQTGYLELEPGYRVQIQKAHLLGTGVPGSLALSYKTAATLDDVDTLQTGFTAMTAVSRGEGASARVDAPYVAFRVTGTGAESQLIRGIRIFYEKTSQL